jgi:CMP-N-acetylneuraminic acid synthetase
LRKLAVIPARGGSKRLPRKNILPFRDKPMIAYTIAAAHQANCFERVLVSTEDSEIADVAISFGAEVLNRPAGLAGDDATVAQTCLNVLDQEEVAGHTYDVLCCLYATAPLRLASDIVATIEMLSPDQCAFSMAVTTPPFSPAEVLTSRSRGSLEPVWPDLINAEKSSLPEYLIDNGSTYAVLVPEFQNHRDFYGPGLRGHRMPLSRSIDIDTAEDLELALFYAERAAR